MSEPTETIQLDETHRICAYPDEDAQCPRGDWEMITGFVKIPLLGDRRLRDVPAVHEFPGDLIHAHDRLGLFFTRARSEGYDPAVERWARIFYGITVQWDHEHGGYWFCDPDSFAANWPKLTGAEKAEMEREVIAQEQEVYRQWADGEVSIITLEQRVNYARVKEDGSVNPDRAADIVLWEEQESLGSCYLDEKYTLLAAARTYFDLSRFEPIAE